jgi:hypothetical protein
MKMTTLLTGLMTRVRSPIFTGMMNQLMEVLILTKGIIDMTHLTCRLLMMMMMMMMIKMNMKRLHCPVPIFTGVFNQKMEVIVLAPMAV